MNNLPSISYITDPLVIFYQLLNKLNQDDLELLKSEIESRISSNIDWDIQPLGECHDTDLAKDLNIKVSIVRTERKRRNIKPFKKSKSFWDKQPLGEMYDDDLAKKLGYKTSTVTRQRRIRKIPAYREFDPFSVDLDSDVEFESIN